MGRSVAAVIVLHNSAATLADCLRALLLQPAVTEVVLVDNASSDAWQDLVPDDARVRSVRNPDNRGFSAACNQGAALCSGEWLLFLNPDCVLPADALGALLHVASGRSGDGLLGAQLLESDGQLQPASRRRAPTPLRLLRGAVNLPPPEWAADPGQAPEFEPMEAISGALMLLPRRLLDAVGGFDEGYRLHFEDLDLCRRVLLSGAWVGIAPRVRATHLKGTSSRRRPIWVEWNKHLGAWRYYTKFERARSPGWLGALLACALLLHLPWAALRATLRTRPR